ncbi:MAG TPA: DUF4245 domain-containing protein [Micromonosporaceae bacterium]
MSDPSPAPDVAHPDPPTVEPETTEPETTEPGQTLAAPTRRRDHTGRDMVLSLAVLLVPILLIVGLLRACGSGDPTVVDTAPAIDDARSARLFPVLVPQALGSDWRPVQASFQRGDDGHTGTLHLGYLTASGGQVLLVESNEDPDGLFSRELGTDVVAGGEVTVGGTSWQLSRVRGEEQALVLAGVENGGTTGATTASGATVNRIVIVVGRAPLDELTALAASLR